jgi:hypothetical protein
MLLKGCDNGTLYLELLGSWNWSIIWYSKQDTMFWKQNLFLFSGEKTGRHLTQMGLVITMLNLRKDWEWLERFKGGCMSVENDVCSGWPLTVTNVEVWEKTDYGIWANQRIRTDETVSEMTTTDGNKWCKNGVRPKWNIWMKSRNLWTTKPNVLKRTVII